MKWWDISSFRKTPFLSGCFPAFSIRLRESVRGNFSVIKSVWEREGFVGVVYSAHRLSRREDGASLPLVTFQYAIFFVSTEHPTRMGASQSTYLLLEVGSLVKFLERANLKFPVEPIYLLRTNYSVCRLSFTTTE